MDISIQCENLTGGREENKKYLSTTATCLFALVQWPSFCLCLYRCCKICRKSHSTRLRQILSLSMACLGFLVPTWHLSRKCPQRGCPHSPRDCPHFRGDCPQQKTALAGALVGVRVGTVPVRVGTVPKRDARKMQMTRELLQLLPGAMVWHGDSGRLARILQWSHIAVLVWNSLNGGLFSPMP